MQKEGIRVEQSKIELKSHFLMVIILLIIQLNVDFMYRFVYPAVNPLRASLIGLTSLIVLYIPHLRRWFTFPPYFSFLPIFSSALFGALLVQAGILISRSAFSALIHALILILTYGIISIIIQMKGRRQK